MLEDYWQRPITPEQLQAEMDRMARNTKQPEMLRELFQALGNDPFVIAECLARPVLSERLLANLARDKKPLDSAQAKRGSKLMAGVSASYTLPKYRARKRMHRRHMDSHQHHQRALCPMGSHRSVDRQRDDRLGRLR